MISLEGRRFWVLGTAPIKRDLVLWGKFWFACVGAIPPCSLLVLASDISLKIATRLPLVAVIHQVTVWMLCIGLAALAVGLGARLPNLREPSPSKIAAGFGGTLNLVLSALYIMSVVLLTAVPCFFWTETALVIKYQSGRELDLRRDDWAGHARSGDDRRQLDAPAGCGRDDRSAAHWDPQRSAGWNFELCQESPAIPGPSWKPKRWQASVRRAASCGALWRRWTHPDGAVAGCRFVSAADPSDGSPVAAAAAQLS